MRCSDYIALTVCSLAIGIAAQNEKGSRGKTYGYIVVGGGTSGLVVVKAADLIKGAVDEEWGWK